MNLTRFLKIMELAKTHANDDEWEIASKYLDEAANIAQNQK